MVFAGTGTVWKILTHSIPVTNPSNPHAYPELLRDDGGWYFNSSIAEQTNVWLGGYHSMCREMQVDKYNYFLNEMIMRKNHMTKVKLAKNKMNPRYFAILTASPLIPT
jgi:hypothetical protein